MTTEQLEKKLKISKNTCIHCPTLELAKQVSSIFDKIGLKWCSGNSYTPHTGWDSHKENTIYYPFNGERSSLEFAQLKGYKIIRAEEFIALHTEEEKFDLENYIPKGELIGFPKEIIIRMLECQEEQGNPRDITVFEIDRTAGGVSKGFFWSETKERYYFWHEVIRYENFALFFEKYTKQEYQELKNNKNMQENNKKEENSQAFKVGDKVIDIITGQKGKILEVCTDDDIAYPIYVNLNENESYRLDGKYYEDDKYPRLLHYRDDYDYSVINFNNLPKRQEAKRWRAKKGEAYYSFTADFKVEKHIEDNDYFDNKAYDLDKYFKTKEEAQEVADNLNKYFQELINPNK